MSDKENILLDPAEMDKIENMPEIKTVSEEDLPAEAEVKEQFEEKPAPTLPPDYPDAVPEASKPEHIGERSVCSIDALIQKILDGERQYDLSKIVSAYELAEKYHHNQKRESGEPYITHPLSVAYILLAWILILFVQHFFMTLWRTLHALLKNYRRILAQTLQCL